MNIADVRGKTARWGRSPWETTTPHDRTRRMGVNVVRLFIERARCVVRRLGGQDGATAVEYALMLALIAMAVFVAVQFLGQQTNSGFSSMSFSP
jgi:Flp pilus assembly pilin Flp